MRSGKIEESKSASGQPQEAQAEGKELLAEAVDSRTPSALQPLCHEKISWTLAECSVVIGLHPDGATDAIVDFALEHDKPFALLPCCVYRKQFPERRLPGGGTVKTYEELLDYLQARSDGIQRASLGFEGRDVVLYRT